MVEHSPQTSSRDGSTAPAEVRGRRGGVLAFLLRHPIGVGQAILVILLAVIVFQNVEPTSFHLLFWSFGAVPKLVLILASMGVGAVVWEVARRMIFRS